MTHSMCTRNRLTLTFGILATILLFTCMGCTSRQSDKGKTLAGNADAMKRVQAAQAKAITNNSRIPPAARATVYRSMEASRTQASRLPRIASNP